MITVQWIPPPADRGESCRPITCTRALSQVPVANRELAVWMRERVTTAISLTRPESRPRTLCIHTDAWLSTDQLHHLLAAAPPAVVTDAARDRLAWTLPAGQATLAGDDGEPIATDDESFIIRYPWDLLRINEILVAGLSDTRIDGSCHSSCVIDGVVQMGPGSRILPGVYIEGKVLIGADCKIGPNCYLRGNTSIGDQVHIGQAVEVKNSLLMNGVSIGHLSYCGDSIIGEKANFGAGTVTANFRHDGQSHRARVDGRRVETGRRKLGTVMGDGVHTGIHTGIYPGRMLWPNTATLPGAIVDRDLTAS